MEIEKMFRRSMMCQLVLVFLAIDLVCGFYPRYPPNYQTKTHFDISNTGILQAVSTYIFETKVTNATNAATAFEEFFGKDHNGKIEFLKTLAFVRNSVAEIQEQKRNVAYVHCNADQIELSHNHLIACRAKLLERQSDIVELRRQLGECLYTIQSFYSNTNWVEMKGRNLYTDFGIKGKQLMSVAAPHEDTCADMKYIDKNCKDNIIINNKLTSGYHHGRGSPKPSRSKGSVAGKCSHGGPEDESREKVAKCGINKDTTLEHLSPHFHLHNDAYYAAVAATKHFLIAEDTGVLQLLGSDIFDSIFQIKQRKQISLSFAVDYSGSMGHAIEAVKEQIIQIVTSTIGSQNEAGDYVLSLFNDPAELNKGYLFHDGFDMIRNVSNVKATGGGDCPELAAAGILKAIELSRADSTVLVFTDADAKDSNRWGEITVAAKAKNIKITSLLTGQCSKKRKRSELQGRAFYQAIATATGGTVYNTVPENIDNVLDEVIQNVFPTSEVIIDSYNWSSSTLENEQNIFVDESLKVLKISIKGASHETQADFYYPNGTLETFKSSTASRIYTSNKEIIMSLQSLLPGVYTLHRNIKAQWAVNITAQSSIKVEGEMLQKTQSESLVAVQGSPVNGNNYTFVLTVFNFPNGTCRSLHITNTIGEIMTDYQPQQTVSDVDISCSVDLVIPNYSFQFMLNGTDASGNVLYRKFGTTYIPASVEMHITASTDDLPIRKELDIYYEVFNAGTVHDSYRVNISNDSSFTVASSSHYHTINAGERVNDSFILQPKRTGVIKYTVSLALESTSNIKQLITRTILVTDIERPTCHILSFDGECGPPSINTANCSEYHWQSRAQITFSGTQLNTISSTGGQSIVMIHDHISNVTSGPLGVNISGTCCTPSVGISAVDVDGYISQCILDFSNGQTVESVEDVSTPSKQTNEDNTYTIIVAVTVCVVVLVVAMVIGMVTKQSLHRRVYKLKTTSISTKDVSPKMEFWYENVMFNYKKEKENQ